MSINLDRSLRMAKNNSQETFQTAVCIAAPSVTYYTTPTVSTDPFSGKTNKYAESKLVAITSLAQAVCVRFGTSAIGAATTSDFCIPAGTTIYIVVQPETPYMRLLQQASAALVYVTEIY